MDDEQLKQVYEMVDSIPFSRTKRNINRDFSDAVMMAELIQHYRPKTVDLHSYQAASSADKKTNNWNTLNNKVLKKFGIGLSKKEIDDIVNSAPMAIQTYLYQVLTKFQSPGQQVHVKTQIKRAQDSQRNTLSPQNVQNKKQVTPRVSNSNQNIKQLIPATENEEVQGLIEEIQETYTQLLKLQEINRMKDDIIKNLEKKVQKMIFS